MPVCKLDHYAVRAGDLETSRRFYEDVLQLRPGFRPPFAFPGVWLYLDEERADTDVVHLVGGGAPGALGDYLGPRTPASSPATTGLLDHIAFTAKDWPTLRRRCEAAGEPYIERTVPGLGLHQVFLTDPSGVRVELNFLP